MKTTSAIGFGVLVILWIWLAWGVLSAGVTLYSLLTVAISGIIVLVPLWRKLSSARDKNKNDHGPR